MGKGDEWEMRVLEGLQDEREELEKKGRRLQWRGENGREGKERVGKGDNQNRVENSGN